MLDRKEIQKMTRPQILADIRNVLENDYAGADRLPKDHCADKFMAAVGTMEEMHMLEDRNFHDFVQLFLSAEGVPGVSFRMKNAGNFRNFHRGFRIRKRGSRLVVTDALPESGLQNGDRILKINGQEPVVYYYRSLLRTEAGSIPDVSSLTGTENWTAVLNHASTVVVEREGEQQRVFLREIPLLKEAERETKAHPVFENLGDLHLALRLPSFEEEESIAAAVEEMAKVLRSWKIPGTDSQPESDESVRSGEEKKSAAEEASDLAGYGLSYEEAELALFGEIPARVLTLDLRGCTGGAPENLLPLLPYLCEQSKAPNPSSKAQARENQKTLGDFFGEAWECIHYTERNCDLLAEQMLPYIDSPQEEYRAFARERLEQIEQSRGEAPVWEKAELLDESLPLAAPVPAFHAIHVLVDETTGREAEWLAARLKGSPRVTVIGRPTSGEMDYGSPVAMDYGFGTTFTYPASRLAFGETQKSARVTPDILLDWSEREETL